MVRHEAADENWFTMIIKLRVLRQSPTGEQRGGVTEQEWRRRGLGWWESPSSDASIMLAAYATCNGSGCP